MWCSVTLWQFAERAQKIFGAVAILIVNKGYSTVQIWCDGTFKEIPNATKCTVYSVASVQTLYNRYKLMSDLNPISTSS